MWGIIAAAELDESECQLDNLNDNNAGVIEAITTQIDSLSNNLDISHSVSCRRSGNSQRSNCSVKSNCSDTAAKVAGLRAKLHHLNIEAEQKLELEKVKLKLERTKTMKELCFTFHIDGGRSQWRF
jgi:Mg2+ and Co2+ transporter CorA